MGSWVYWGLRLSEVTSAGSTVSAAAAPPLAAPPDPTQVGRWLEAPRAAGPADAPSARAAGGTWVLTGVVAGVSGRGAALVAVDGLSPRAYTVGSPVADGLVLQAVQGRRAQFGPSLQGPPTRVLELPPLAR